MGDKSSVARNCYKLASRCLYGGWILCTCVMACMIATILILRVENQSYTITAIAASKLVRGYSPYVTRTYVKNRPLEAVDVEYKRNIFFTVKTTASNYKERLSTLILTWFQTVHRDDIAIISDDITSGKSYNNAIKEAGFHLITTNCPHTHVRMRGPKFCKISKASQDNFKLRYTKALCCKSGEEFHSYYKAVGNNSSYQWFCHVDDDVYVNVPRLSRLLQKYDPRQPHYLGRWVHEDPSMNLTKRTYNHFENKNINIKADGFQYATGAAYCISHALMTEARKYFDGKEAFCQNTDLVLYGDDVTIGLIVHVLLGYHLTNVEYFSNQYERIRHATSVSRLKKYITVSYKKNKSQQFVHLLPIKNMFAEDQTRFMSFHCLLYPNVSWCKKQ